MEIVDVHRHAAEKLHAMLRDFGDREHTRVRDLVDLVILIEHGMLDPATVAAATRQVFSERDAVEPPAILPSLPESSRRALTVAAKSAPQRYPKPL